MSHLRLTAVLFALCIIPADTSIFADELLPKEQPPVMSSARLLDNGELLIRQMVLVPVQSTETQKVTVVELRTEIIGGKTVAKPVEIVREVPIVVTKQVSEVREQRLKKAGYHVLDLEGKKVEGDSLAAAFSKERPVLVTSQSQPLESFYASFFKAGTLVVYVHGAEARGTAAVPVPGAIRLDVPAIKAVTIPVPAVVPAPAAIPVLPAPPALPVPEPVRSKPPR